MPRILPLILASLLLFFSFSESVFGQGMACSATVVPDTVDTGSYTTFTAQVTNTGTTELNWVAVAFDGNFTVVGYESDWLGEVNSGTVYFRGGTIGVGESKSFGVNATASSSEVTGVVTTQASESYGGELLSCGDSSVSIHAPVVVPVPVIGGLVASVSSTQATISWTTDVPATSSVNYGLTSGYGSAQNGDVTATSHSFTLSSLIASTTYHFKVTSTNTGGTTESTDNTFTTSAAGVTTVVTTTVTTTTVVTSTTTVTVTPTPRVDRIPPVVRVTTKFDRPYEKAPSIWGKLSDDESLKSAEYSTDGGVNWLEVDDFVGGGEVKGSFEFTPQIREDGNYAVVVRALDKMGNVGKSEEMKLVIDRLPPRIGGALWSIGPFALVPDVDGNIRIVSKTSMKVTVSAVGGPTDVVLLAGEREYRLEKSTNTGLWSSVVDINSDGSYPLKVTAVDGAQNVTERDFGTILVEKPGNVKDQETGNNVSDGMVKLFWKDPGSGMWTMWDGKTFGQENPVRVDESGDFRLVIPAGEYYLEATAPGYKGFRSKIFNVDKITPLNTKITLNKAVSIKVFKWELGLSGWDTRILQMSDSVDRKGTLHKLIGEKIPSIRLPSVMGGVDVKDLEGEPGVVTFISTWSPAGMEQISVLDDLLYKREINGMVIVPQESLAGVKVFTSRGGYKLNLGVDADGEIVEKYNLTTLPAHFVLNRNGVVVETRVGVLNKDELLELVKKY